jgi:hypothetical protein
LWLIAAALGLAGLVLYFRRAVSASDSRVMLESIDSAGRALKREVPFDPKTNRAVLQRDAHSVAFELRDGRVRVWESSGDESGRVVLAIAGTPCLPGEVFMIADGQEICLGQEAFTVRLQIEVTSSEPKNA